MRGDWLEKAEALRFPISTEAKAVLVGWGFGLDGIVVENLSPLVLRGYRGDREIEVTLNGEEIRAQGTEGMSWQLPPFKGEEFSPDDLRQIARWMAHFDAWMGALQPPDPWDLFLELLSVLSDWEPVRLGPELGGLSPDVRRSLEEGEVLLFRVTNPVRAFFGPPLFAIAFDRLGECVYVQGDDPEEVVRRILQEAHG